MLDIKFIRENKDKIKDACQKRGVEVDVDRVLEVDEKRREVLEKIEAINAKKNKANKEIIGLKEKAEKPAQNYPADNIEAGPPASLRVAMRAGKRKIISEMQKIDKEGDKLKKELKEFNNEFQKLMCQIPNLCCVDVPAGKDESNNVVLKETGKRPNFKFKIKDYLEISKNLDLIDIERASKVSGSRFGYLKRELALMEFALINLTFDTLIKQGFIPLIPPVMIKPEMLKAMGYIDTENDKAERYFLEKDNLFLIGTSEQAIGPMHADEIFAEKELPKRYLAFSTCFREEAGSYGKDTKGILRVHQFDKIEMFSFVKPEDSEKEHKYLLSLEEKLMKLLKLPYKVVQLCTGDLARPSASTYDIETWIPSENKYRETHSTSNCTDFQARRLNIRYKKSKDNKLEFVHMLNGTAFAIGRILIAIIENYQQKDGSIKVPKTLQKYLGFKTIKTK